MKLLTIVLLLSGSLAAFATDTKPAADENYFLNSEELKSMPREERARYLKSLQKIIAVMAKQTLYMASDERIKFSRLPASASGKSVDQLLEEQSRKNFDMAIDSFADINGEGFSFRENNKVRTYPVKAAEVQSRPLPALAPAASASAALASKPAATASPAKTDTATAVLEKPTAKNDQKSEVKDTSVIIETKDGKIVSGKEVVTESTDKKTKRAHYRCMYSGWVVEKDPCQPQRSFPVNYSIKGVDKSKMACRSKDTMCNPTLFGLRLPTECKKLSDCSTEAVPLCVPKGAWPTEDCYNVSTYQDTLVAAEIASGDSSQYDRFTKNFADLCDKEQIKTNPFAEPNNRSNRRATPEGVRRDIEITCSWAKKKMKDTTEAYRIAAVVNGGKTPASKPAAEDSKSRPKVQQ